MRTAHMNMKSDSDIHSVFCPIENEHVEVEEECRDCEYWDENECALTLPRHRLRTRSRHPRKPRRPWRPRGGGGGRHRPAVGDQWARGGTADDDPDTHGDGPDYGEYPAEFGDDPYEVPEDEIDWDHEPFVEDVPDWIEWDRDELEIGRASCRERV